MIKLLFLIRDISAQGFALYKKISKALSRKRVDDAFAKSENDQRPIEDLISSSSGLPSNDDYDGMHSRPAKKRD